jgi:hypothetical protein
LSQPRVAPPALEIHSASTLEFKNATCFVLTGNFKAQPFDDLSDLPDLSCVCFSQFTLAESERVFEANTHIATHGGYGHLIASSPQHRPATLIIKQTVSRTLHMRHIFRVVPNTTQNAKYTLYKERWLDDAPLGTMCKRVKMTDVVTFDFKARAFPDTGRGDMLNIFKRVFENAATLTFKIVALPRVLECLEAHQHRVKPEIHGAHVEGSHFRFERRSGQHALLNRHGGYAPCGDVHHAIGPLLDGLQDRFKCLG